MKRRSFIGALSIGAVGLASGQIWKDTGRQKKMALQLYSVRQAVAKDLEATLEKLAGIGYDQLEIYGYDGKFFGHTPSAFKEILKRTGMTVISSHHVTGLSGKVNGSLTNGWEQAVEDLHSIGSKYMVCSYLFPQERTAEIYKSLPGLLNRSGEQAKKSGIQFGYHNHDFEFEKFQDTLVYDHLLNNTNPELVIMELDLYWISRAGQDPLKYFEKYPKRFPLWHVKDMEAGSKDITEVGNGTIDFDKVFAAGKQAGLKHWFVEQDVSKGDMFESLKKSYGFLSRKKYS
ncbi:sugar phosphate isomerase/epimerase [Terrimonas sp. NA20]|uniref:Sugar phosphate isomerase/epimerase n=1 Tax=Terrimonas ginsenosidimutans TaxID=2908004 RepID=A0ABS9KS60_9BACT|nr:sugar phosphate isomerase/epimerase [Terrimonas ginsenosidimutans]MCG2615156.1 sugar phosphate isomerase/epimerase [Terrimonas ginsenosidimutans]